MGIKKNKSNKHNQLVEELNQEQKKAVFSENKHTLLAGAGTGKTKTLFT